MMDAVWKFRELFYIALLVFLFGSHIKIEIIKNKVEKSNLSEEQEQFLRSYRQLNASFWPPDLIPHPGLPEPSYPPPGSETPIWEYV
jgi:hypothetical protein